MEIPQSYEKRAIRLAPEDETTQLGDIAFNVTLIFNDPEKPEMPNYWKVKLGEFNGKYTEIGQAKPGGEQRLEPIFDTTAKLILPFNEFEADVDEMSLWVDENVRALYSDLGDDIEGFINAAVDTIRQAPHAKILND